MKKLFIAVLSILFLQNCKLQSTADQDDVNCKQNQVDIEQYFTTNSITPNKIADAGYYYYYVLNKSNPDSIKPTTGLQVTVKYKTRLLTKNSSGIVIKSNVLDSVSNSNALTFALNSGYIITGFNDAVAQLRKGEIADVYLPSCLGFGSQQSDSGKIAPYSILYFQDLQILNIRTEDRLLLDYINTYNIKNKVADSTTAPVKTTSGLYYAETLTGTGDYAKEGQTVSIKYTGKFASSNTEFSSSSTATGSVSSFVSGFKEGLKLMKVGGKATLLMPSSLAYAEKGSGIIPPYAPLVFEVELISAY